MGLIHLKWHSVAQWSMHKEQKKKKKGFFGRDRTWMGTQTS